MALIGILPTHSQIFTFSKRLSADMPFFIRGVFELDLKTLSMTNVCNSLIVIDGNCYNSVCVDLFLCHL